MPSYGRYHVAESPRALLSLHLYRGEALHEVTHEPKVAVLDQEDLVAQGITTATVVPGAKAGIDALGSCTANASMAALSNILTAGAYLSYTQAASLADVVAVEEAAIRFYHACTEETGTPQAEWPPVDCGSSGPYIVEEMVSEGVAAGTRIAHGATDLVSLMQATGVLAGIPFLLAWEQPGPGGFVDGDGSVETLEAQIRQGVAGGHEVYLSAVEQLVLTPAGRVTAQRTVVRFRNSWGASWGDQGSARFHLSTLVALGSQADFRQLVA